MKKLISTLVVVLFLYSCQDSNITGPVSGSSIDEDYSYQKVVEPRTHNALHKVYGEPKFIPNKGLGGHLGKNTIFYPATLLIDNEENEVIIIRNMVQKPGQLSNDMRGTFWGTFEIVVKNSNGNSKPTGTETVLFRGKYVGKQGASIIAEEIKYNGKGDNSYLGSTLMATEELSYIQKNEQLEKRGDGSNKVELLNFNSVVQGELSINELSDE